MYIHNLYNDLMLSISMLFDHVIFEDNQIIKKYEFNLGNRTFQLGRDPKVNVNLPAAIISINDENSYFGQRTESLKKLITPNINNIPVLYNKSNNYVLYLNEEYMHIPISIIINTESQLQAKEISHIIRRFLPLNKFICQLEFRSFLEITLNFLKQVYFDPYNHDIMNLFTKYDNLIGDTNFCFSVKYEPHIRLDSISAAAPDSTQRTFQVNVDLTYGMQWPIFLYCGEYNLIENINIQFMTSEMHPISSVSSPKVFTYDKNKIIRNHIIYETSNQLNLTHHQYVYFTFQPDKEFIDIANKNLTYNLVSLKNGKFLYNIHPYSFIDDENKITFEVTRDDYDNYLTPSIINPIMLQSVNG